MTTAVRKDHASQKRRNFISKFLIYFFLIVITACMLMPFLWMLSSSFKLNKDVFGFPIQWIPQNPRWQNYVDIWTLLVEPLVGEVSPNRVIVLAEEETLL